MLQYYMTFLGNRKEAFDLLHCFILKHHTPRPLDAVGPELALQSQMIKQPHNIYRDRLQRHPGLHRIRARLLCYGLAHTAELTAVLGVDWITSSVS
jgi:hypothetical protein